MESRREKNIPLSVMAEDLNRDPDEFVETLRRDGFLSGNTQSLYAHHLKLFEVEQGAARFRGGLYHRTGFDIKVRPEGRRFFMRIYGQNNGERRVAECTKTMT